MRQRILVAAAIAVCSGAFCWLVLTRLHQGSADFYWTMRAARSMLAHQNPYDTPLEQYPLTAALFGIPFLAFPAEIAAGLFFGISSGLLAFGLLKEGGYSRLFVFFAYPYWGALMTAQWSPLIMAGALIPILLPVTMAKPQLGIPVFLTRASRIGVIACVVALGITLALVPRWPLWWIGQFGHYEHFFPVLVLPGFLLLAALTRYRDRDAWFLVLAALVPQRWFFDSFILWLIPKSRREILYTTGCSWFVGVWRWYHMPHSMTQVGRWTVLGFYLPMLLVIFMRARSTRMKPAVTPRGTPGTS